MMVRAFQIAAALCVSLAIHAFGLSAFEKFVPAGIQPASNISEVEIAAVTAFQKLDAERQSANRVDAVSSELASDLVQIETPKIDIPKPVSTPIQKKPSAKSAPPKATASASASAKKTAPAKTTVIKKSAPSGPSAAQVKQAYSAFGSQVRNALVKSLRAPRGVQSVRAVVVVRFKNGRLSSVALQASSGNKKFDDAVINAARKARYGNPPSGLANDTSYKIPVGI